MNRIQKPYKDNSLAGIINMYRDYDNIVIAQPSIKVTKITLWEWFKITGSSWWTIMWHWGSWGVGWETSIVGWEWKLITNDESIF